MTCEICGSSDLIKADGVFKCQTCGMKYSLEEIKNLALSRKSTKGDDNASVFRNSNENPDEFDNKRLNSSKSSSSQYLLARRAIKVGDLANAKLHYSKILSENPNCWESQFYVVYCGLNGFPEVSAPILENNVVLALNLIKDYVSESEQASAIGEIHKVVVDTGDLYFEYAYDKYNKYPSLKNDDSSIKECCDRLVKTANMLFVFADTVATLFGVKSYKSLICSAIKEGIEIRNYYTQIDRDILYECYDLDEILVHYEQLLNKLAPSEQNTYTNRKFEICKNDLLLPTRSSIEDNQQAQALKTLNSLCTFARYNNFYNEYNQTLKDFPNLKPFKNDSTQLTAFCLLHSFDQRYISLADVENVEIAKTGFLGSKCELSVNSKYITSVPKRHYKQLKDFADEIQKRADRVRHLKYDI